MTGDSHARSQQRQIVTVRVAAVIAVNLRQDGVEQRRATLGVLRDEAVDPIIPAVLVFTLEHVGDSVSTEENLIAFRDRHDLALPLWLLEQRRHERSRAIEPDYLVDIPE